MADILITDYFKKQFLTNFSSSIGLNTTSGEGTENNLEDPTYVGFHLEFMFDQIESANGVSCGLLLNRDNPNSALNYLDRIGEGWRSDLLAIFIENLRHISLSRPWYFQSISGLNKMIGINMADGLRISPDNKLEVECLESIDFKMTKLFDLYKKATYDTVYMRDILPDHLRKFNLRVHVAEIRKFHEFVIGENSESTSNKPNSPLMQVYGGLQDIYNLGQNTNIKNIVNEAGQYLGADGKNINSTIGNINSDSLSELKKSAVKIKNLDNFLTVLTVNLMHCTFDLEEINPFMNELSNAEISMATQKFSIRALNSSETNTYPLSKLLLRDAIINSLFPGKSIQSPIDGSTLNVPYTIDDVIQMVWKDDLNTEQTEKTKLEKENNLLKGSIFDKVKQGLGTYSKYKNELDKRLESLGINYNPLDTIEAEIKEKAQSVLNSTILGNIHGFAPTDVVNSIKNAIDGISKSSEFTLDKNIGLEENNNNFQSSGNINLESNIDTLTISGSGLSGNSNNFIPDNKIDISGNPNTFTPENKIVLDSNSSQINIDDISLSDSSTTYIPSKIILDESITNYTTNDNINLSNNSSTLDVQKNINLDIIRKNESIDEIKISDTPTNNEIQEIKLEESVVNKSIQSIYLDSLETQYKINPVELNGNINKYESEKNINLNETINNLNLQLLSKNIFEQLKTSKSEITNIGKLESLDNQFKISNILIDETPINKKIEEINLESNNNQFEIEKNINLKDNNIEFIPSANISAESTAYYSNDIQKIELTESIKTINKIENIYE